MRESTGRQGQLASQHHHSILSSGAGYEGGETLTDPASAFATYFEKCELPEVSGVAIGVGTDAITAKATTKSFVSGIELLR